MIVRESTSMILYAIRDADSGEFLPGGKKRGRDSFTHFEPTREGTPRLFNSTGAARSALAAWYKGKLIPSYGEYQDISGEWHPEFEFKIEPVSGRKERNMKIISVHLKWGKEVK